jgi:Neurochondrin
MAESSSRGNDAEKDPNAGLDPSATFQRIQDLLKARDDTSRFVGLALLKTVLDNGQLFQNSERLRVLWESLSPKFLDRLLRAQQNEKVNEAEARNMMDLAVAILHTFTIILPEDSRKEKRLTGRTAPLVKALLKRFFFLPENL